MRIRARAPRSKRSTCNCKDCNCGRADASDAVARERERLGYELHDGICQQLVGMAYLLSPLIGSAVQRAPELARELEHIGTLLQETLRASRALAHDWADSSERELSRCEAAFKAQAARLQDEHQVSITFDASLLFTLRLDGSMLVELEKFALEAMRNAVRHGRAGRIAVLVREAGTDWQLDISDDGVGVGLPSDSTRHGRLGLRSMRHRASRVGGRFEIMRLTPRGTCVRLSWPKQSPG